MPGSSNILKGEEALQRIEDQLYAINARNISMRWIGLRKTPTMEEISELNALLGFIVLEIRTLREKGEIDIDALHEQKFGKLSEDWKPND
jgi:hypothetical protein